MRFWRLSATEQPMGEQTKQTGYKKHINHQSIQQSISQLVNQSINQSINQASNQSIDCQPNNQLNKNQNKVTNQLMNKESIKRHIQSTSPPVACRIHTSIASMHPCARPYMHASISPIQGDHLNSKLIQSYTFASHQMLKTTVTVTVQQPLSFLPSSNHGRKVERGRFRWSPSQQLFGHLCWITVS